jgi:hypothetical protein
MTVDRVIRQDGAQVSLEQLSGEVSASLFQTDKHYALCAEVARAQVTDEGVFKVLHNLLALKSRVLMGLSALLAEPELGLPPPRQVVLSPALVRAVGQTLSARGIEVVPLPHDTPLLPRSVAVAFFLKAVLHRLYRLVARPVLAGVPMVRAWVDVTDVMYDQLYERAQVRVFPFSHGMRRQLAYVRSLGRRGVRWSFDGVPFRVADALAALLAPGATRHLRLARAEWLAYDRFGRELLRAGVKEVYSSDEYEVGAVAAGARLRQGGAAYVNTAHGIGLYCPQVAYTRFDYLNDYQAAFYRRMGNPMALNKREKMNSRLPFERNELEQADPLALVYVHQNFEAYNLPSERAAQDRIMGALSPLARSLGLQAVLKLHPNTPAARFRADLPADVRVAGRWDELRGLRPVFLTIYSTAYYELAPVAPVLVYRAPTYSPQVYLDGEFQTFDVSDLAERVAPLRDRATWAALVDRQWQSLQGVPA